MTRPCWYPSPPPGMWPSVSRSPSRARKKTVEMWLLVGVLLPQSTSLCVCLSQSPGISSLISGSLRQPRGEISDSSVSFSSLPSLQTWRHQLEVPLCPGRSPSLPLLPPPTSGETSPNPQGEEGHVLCGGPGAKALSLKNLGATALVQTFSGQPEDRAPECPLWEACFSPGRLFAGFHCWVAWSHLLQLFLVFKPPHQVLWLVTSTSLFPSSPAATLGYWAES